MNLNSKFDYQRLMLGWSFALFFFIFANSFLSQNNDTISSEIFNLEGNKVGLVLSEVKQEHSRLCLFSMNKNYDGGEVRFQDSSLITFE